MLIYDCYLWFFIHFLQVYLISFAVQWNSRMESLKVAGGHGRLTTIVDPRQIQKLNTQASVLFGDEHLFEPNFSAPMPYAERYDNPVEEELLGVEYAYCQSTDFTSKEYYIEKGLLTLSCPMKIVSTCVWK